MINNSKDVMIQLFIIEERSWKWKRRIQKQGQKLQFVKFRRGK